MDGWWTLAAGDIELSGPSVTRRGPCDGCQGIASPSIVDPSLKRLVKRQVHSSYLRLSLLLVNEDDERVPPGRCARWLILLFALSVARDARPRMMGDAIGRRRHLRHGPRRQPRIDTRSPPIHLVPQQSHRSVSNPVPPYATCVATTARRTLDASYTVPSRQIAKRIPASRRARATTAIGRPRRPAMRSAHSRSAAVSHCFRRRRMHHAAWTNSHRMRPLPALVIRPRRWISLELHSEGTSPR